MLEQALRVIPLGSQTFSKSKTQLPLGVSPYFVERAQGSHFWDVDGNEYIDFANALACVTLGYCDPDVDAAVQEQMSYGVTFSLPHRLEMEVAEQLIELIPSAEMVRFAKNGSDATSGAIRVARAFTGNDHIAVCGYHGWQDWYIGSTTRNLGVPESVRSLTHHFDYNDLSSLERLLEKNRGGFAAVIMEPMNVDFPQPGFLEGVRDLTHRHGALLIYDETITGFRLHNRGAQTLFGVTPDLSTFGKGIANGHPLSVVVGRTKYMKVMEDIFFSGTFGGETLSLSAANAVLHKILNEPVIATLAERGKKVKDSVNRIINDLDMQAYLNVSGHPSWSFLNFKNIEGATSWEIKTLYLQEMFFRGIYILGTHTMSYSHTNEDIDVLLEAYSEVLELIKEAVLNGEVKKRLLCETLVPLFRVR